MTVKATDRGIAQIVDALGDRTYYGIEVEGHCMGIVGRTWRDPTQSSGYAYASDGAKAVTDAGKMRTSKPPRGSIVWFSTGGGRYAKPGHVLTMEDDVRTIGNIGATIQRRDIGAWSLQRLGWCWPEDVPTWGKSPTPGGGGGGGGGGTVPPEIDTMMEDEDMFIFKTHQNDQKTGAGVGGGAHYMVSHGTAVQCQGGYGAVGDIPVILSSSEAMDEAFYKSVKLFKL